MKSLTQIYHILFEKYGKQGWWPTTPKYEVVPQYNNSNRKLKEDEMLEICIGAILTQNTSWSNVQKALININKEYKNLNESLIDFIKNIKLEKLKSLIKPAGFFNQKSKYIKNLVNHIIENHKSSLNLFFDKQKDKLREELLSIKGIGKETADSIILYASNKPIFIIDMYTKRMFSRLGYLAQNQSYDNWQNFFKQNLKEDLKFFNEYHALIVEHNKRFCKSKPECKYCFLQKNCEWFANKNTQNN